MPFSLAMLSVRERQTLTRGYMFLNNHDCVRSEHNKKGIETKHGQSSMPFLMPKFRWHVAADLQD
jgi:hypothetical protein